MSEFTSVVYHNNGQETENEAEYLLQANSDRSLIHLLACVSRHLTTR